MPTRGPPPTPIVSHESPALIRDQSDFPKVALPTIALAAVSIGGLLLCHRSCLFSNNNDDSFSLEMQSDFYKQPSFYALTLLKATLTYGAFTVMHDASHGSIARPNSGFVFLNELLGFAAALCFGAPFHVFKKIHLDHHKYTNAVDYDADLWAGGNFGGTAYRSKLHPVSRFFALPLRCMTQLYHYLIHAHHYLLPNWGAFEAAVNLIIILPLAIFPALSAIFFTKYNYFFWGYHLPVLLAVMILGMCFDYLPHRPHATTTDPIKATSLITLWDPKKKTDSTTKKKGQSSAQSKMMLYTPEEIKDTGIDFLNLPLLYQNFHPIHHLYPNIPFYRYSHVYWRMAEVLQGAGLDAHPLFPLIVEKKEQ